MSRQGSNEATVDTVDTASSGKMIEIIMGANKACIIYVAAKFNIVDHLYENPMTADQLAAITETKPDMLYRLLRALASIEILIENTDKTFSVTKFGLTLKDGIKGGVKYVAFLMLGPLYIANGQLEYTIRTGKPAFDHVFGMSHFDYVKAVPEFGDIFSKSMREWKAISLAFHIAANYDFSPYKHIIDVGGGVGDFLVDILEHTPNAKGTLLEMEHVAEMAKHAIAKSDVKDRITIVSGSFFDFVPPDGDLYISKFIIHDWSDEQAIQILKNIRKQMKNGCKVLIMEMVLPDGDEPDLYKVEDVFISSILTGKERTKDEFISLFEKASLKLNEMSKISPCEIQIMELDSV